MRNHWLSRIEKRQIIIEVNKLLLSYVGKKYNSSDELGDLIEQMRLKVLEFFRNNPHKLQHFIVEGTISYRFNIQGNKVVERVQWEPR